MTRKPPRARAQYKSIRGIEHKLCTGPLHRDGAWVPLETGFYRRQSRGKDLPRPECIACEGSRQNSEPRVPYERYKFAVEELVNRLGKAEAARRIGIRLSTLWEWRTKKQRFIKRRHARALVLALRDVRQRDEVRHRDSIRHGAGQRGRTEKKVTSKKHLYNSRGDSDKAAREADAKRKREERARQRSLTSA